jgi:hypothetical protein
MPSHVPVVLVVLLVLAGLSLRIVQQDDVTGDHHPGGRQRRRVRGDLPPGRGRGGVRRRHRGRAETDRIIGEPGAFLAREGTVAASEQAAPATAVTAVAQRLPRSGADRGGGRFPLRPARLSARRQNTRTRRRPANTGDRSGEQRRERP